MVALNTPKSEDAVLLHELITLSDNKFLAIITLNRPKAMNSLNLELAQLLLSTLNDFRESSEIVAVLLRGAGERGFCAGGDIKELYASAIETPGGPCVQAEAFFATEYQLDYTLHTYPKPIVVWGDGVIMGGGVGLFQGGSHRVVESNARLAMPEVTIGLFPDVAASYLFNQLPQAWGRFFALTGAAMNAVEAVELGIANFHVKENSLEELLQNFTSASWDSGDVSEVLSELLNELKPQQESLPLSRLKAVSNEVESIFLMSDLSDVYQDVRRLMADENTHSWLQDAFQRMLEASPLSVACSDQALRLNKGQSLHDVFKFDLIYATRMVRHPEFSEGVRALLVDKDKQPKWMYKNIEDIPVELLVSMLKAPWEQHPFDAWKT